MHWFDSQRIHYNIVDTNRKSNKTPTVYTIYIVNHVHEFGLSCETPPPPSPQRKRNKFLYLF